MRPRHGGVRTWLLRGLALVCCSGLVHGAPRAGPVYLIWGQVAPGYAPETFEIDARLREVRRWPDTFAVARSAAIRLRFHSVGSKDYLVDGKRELAPCQTPARHYAFTPSGSTFACAAGYYPNVVVRVYRTNHRRLIATFRPPNASPEGFNPVAFLDEDRLLFQSYDPDCPEHFSVAMMSIRNRFPVRTQVRCASGVVVGNRRVAYVRGKTDTEYSMDGRTWISQRLYALDQDDRPITPEAPLIRAFMAAHPDGLISWVSVGTVEQ